MYRDDIPMTELKTLKDIDSCENPLHETNKSSCGDCSVSTLILKEEAIKWIKHLRAETKEDPNAKICEVQLFTDNKKRKGNPIGKAMHDSVRRETYNYILEKWIKEFFNISE